MTQKWVILLDLINKGEEILNKLDNREDISINEIMEFSKLVSKLNKKSEINFAVLIAWY